MSHFTVLVIGDDVDGQLAPFQENNMGDCPEEYMEFEVEIEFGKEKEYQDSELSGEWMNKPERKADLIKYKAMSPEEFIKEYTGWEKGENGWGYMTNPNCRWDWYQIGGRWAGMFKLKNGVAAPVPNFSYGWDAKEREKMLKQNRTDQAQKGDIDFAGMIAADVERAGLQYDTVEKFYGGKIPKITIPWKSIIDNKNYKDWDIDAKRKLYHDQPAKKTEKKLKAALPDTDRDLRWTDLEDYQCTKEEYLKGVADRTISTFAVLRNGEWLEKGRMGWWGMHDATDEDAKEWNKSFYDTFIKDLPDDTLLTIVDCHI
ncbi:hypothetical protein ACFL4H_00175 [Candidatus Neomarinimicrobiota bacterium]